MLVKYLARRRQPDAACSSLKELHPQFPFQGADLLADGRLRDVAFLGGAG